jgi:excisionase family DNA binding protein
VEPLAVDLKTASKLASLSVRTLRRQISAGHLRSIRVGRRLLVPVASLRALLLPSSDAEGSNARNTSE